MTIALGARASRLLISAAIGAAGLASLVPAGGAHALPAGCTPIATAAQLQSIASDPSGSYCLTADIDASSTASWNNGGGFIPITGFWGTLDGQGHVVRGLTIKHAPGATTGLVATLVAGGEIENLGLVNAAITGRADTGGLVGSIINGTLAYTFTSGSIQSSGNSQYGTGGLAGRLVKGTIEDSYTTASITSTGASITGGLVGLNGSGSLLRDYSDATVTAAGGGDTGGLAGDNGGIIADAFNEGPVSGLNAVGGVAGTLLNGSISNVFTTGPVSGGSFTGLLIGVILGGKVSNTFWDLTTNPAEPGIDWNFAQGSTNEVVGYPDDQMHAELNFSEFGWDFDGTWGIVEGVTYPFLLDLTTRGVTVRGDYCAAGGVTCTRRVPPSGQPATGPGWTFADVEVQTLATSASPQPFHAHLECRSVYASGSSIYQDVGAVDTSAAGSTLSGNLIILGRQAVVTAKASSTLSSVASLPDPGTPYSDSASLGGTGAVDPTGNNGSGRLVSGLFRLTITGDILTYVWDGSAWQYSNTKSNGSLTCTAGSGINLLYSARLSQSTPAADTAQIRVR
jgi:hypothetical protein